jgi:hypothetical protein
MVKSRTVAIIKEAGSLNFIIDVVSPDMAGDKRHEYFKLTKPVANKILTEMDMGKSVYFPKTVEGTLKVGDLIMKEMSDLEKRKNKHLSLYRRQTSELFVNMNFMALYDFMMINNKFCSIGAFIHSENKEEQYLKIINTGDESMIDDLERFLERMDELDKVNNRYKRFRDAMVSISSASNDEELDDVLNGLTNV